MNDKWFITIIRVRQMQFDDLEEIQQDQNTRKREAHRHETGKYHYSDDTRRYHKG